MVVPSIARHVPHFNMPNTCRMRNIRNASLSASLKVPHISLCIYIHEHVCTMKSHSVFILLAAFVVAAVVVA